MEILGRRFPSYELVLIAAGPLVLGAVWSLLRRTRFGMLIRAATQDRDMVAALGVNQALLFTGTLFLGAFLAGLGGALQIPRVAANTGMDLSIIAECFVVTVVGGMGSVPGAFLAALIIGQLQAFGILIFPKSTLVVVFLLMAAVLAVRPFGFFGRPEIIGGTHAVGISTRKPMPHGIPLALGGILLLAGLPLVGDPYLLKVATEFWSLRCSPSASSSSSASVGSSASAMRHFSASALTDRRWRCDGSARPWRRPWSPVWCLPDWALPSSGVLWCASRGFTLP